MPHVQPSQISQPKIGHHQNPTIFHLPCDVTKVTFTVLLSTCTQVLGFFAARQLGALLRQLRQGGDAQVAEALSKKRMTNVLEESEGCVLTSSSSHVYILHCELPFYHVKIYPWSQPRLIGPIGPSFGRPRAVPSFSRCWPPWP